MSESSNAHAEKRGFLRMQMNIPANIEITADGKQEKGVLVNLSGSGMLLELPQFYPAGAKMTVQVDSENGASPSLEAICTVIREAEPIDGGKHRIGVAIDKIL
ncbi:PilZ domain-containing protein [Halioxenophilus aromaticivorans]|uniref:PilZ domain-containing protein n=1 Tax=Halioxenophilus aromaticivorans TaxID=1306992 RepID=A0AAV3TZC7_9ALTE